MFAASDSEPTRIPLGEPSRVSSWIAATRPKTLPASIIPVLVGSALAYRHGAFQPLPALAALVSAVLIQIGTNLANDYYDYRRGVDNAQRLGPPRASASGWIPPRRVFHAAVLAFLLASAVGVYLIWVGGWPILLIGLLALLSGYAYTGGPYPLGYHGWGDVFVFVFFGLVAVTGTYYVQAGPAPLDVLLASLPIGCLSTAILVVNNLRDLSTDARTGKRTLAVRLGPTGTRLEYLLLLLGAYAVPLLLVLTHRHPPLALLPLFTLPLAVLLVAELWRSHDPHLLNPILPRTAALLTVYGLLFAVGVAA